MAVRGLKKRLCGAILPCQNRFIRIGNIALKTLLYMFVPVDRNLLLLFCINQRLILYQRCNGLKIKLNAMQILDQCAAMGLLRLFTWQINKKPNNCFNSTRSSVSQVKQMLERRTAAFNKSKADKLR